MGAIKEIIMENIKGQNTIQKLTGKDIIVGPNGIGKTTRLQSLGISLTGYVPGNGKQNAETFKLCSGGDMTVGVVTDDFKVTRTFSEKVKSEKDGSTSCSYSQDINVYPSKGEKKNSQKESRIEEELGSLPVMLDFNEFLKLTDNKRRDFIYSLSPKKESDWDRDMVEQYLRDELLTFDLEVNNPDQFQIMEQIIFECMKQFPEGFDIQAGLQAMTDWAENKRSHWREEKENSQGAVRKIADLKNQLKETDRNLIKNKKELEDFQNKYIEVEKQLIKADRNKKAYDIRLEKITNLKAKIKALSEKEIDTDTAAIEDKIKLLKVSIENQQNYTDLIKKEKADLKKSQDLKDGLKDNINNYKNKLVEHTVIITNLEKTIDTINEHSNVCVIDTKIACNKDFSRYMEYANLQIIKNQEQAEKIKAGIAKEESKIKKVTTEIQLIEREMDSLEKKKELQAQNNEKARATIASLEKEKDQKANAETIHKNNLTNLQEQLKEVEDEKIEPVIPMEPLEKSKAGYKVRITELKSKIEEQEKAKNTLSSLKSTMIDSKKAQYFYTNFRSLYSCLGASGIQGELVKEILEPIRADIQANFKAMGLNYDFYFRTESEGGKEIFQFGWKNDFGDKRNFDALSTGQQILLLIALMTTIIEKANPNSKILAIDKVENLDYNNFRKVLQGANCLEEKLDNLILLIRTPWKMELPEVLEGFNVCNLDKEGALDESAA